MTAAFAAVAGEYLVSNLLLFGRQRCVERFLHRESFADTRRCRGHEGLLALQPLDGVRAFTVGVGCHFCTMFLHPHIAVLGLLAHHTGEVIPLHFLRIGDFQRSPDVGQARFDAFAG